MRKKLPIVAVVSLIAILSLSHHDPLQLFVNFLVGGIVPGLNLSLGFLPSLAVIIGLLALIRRWVKELRFQMIRRTALEINAERAKQQLTNPDLNEQREQRQAVVAAQGLEAGTSSNI